MSEYRMPVIIPAYRGREYIDGALSALPSELFQPIVAANGEDDGTVRRAKDRWGADAFMATEHGKMPAIQQALQRMGKAALSPFAIMDVDTQIVRPHDWMLEVHAKLANFNDKPLYMTGPLRFSHPNWLEAAARTAWYNYRVALGAAVCKVSTGPAPLRAHYGPNTVFHAANQDVLDDVLALDNYWPGEDRAMADVVLRHEGIFYQNPSRRMLARTPLSESYDPMAMAVLRKIGRKLGIIGPSDGYVTRYIQRGPLGSRPYPSPEHPSR